MDIQEINAKRQTLINALAVFGFITLISGSLWLAAYSTKYVPAIAGRIGTAAVYLGSVFTPAPKASLSVTPTEPTVIKFGEEASSTISTTTVPATGTTNKETITRPAPKVPGSETSKTYTIGGATSTPAVVPVGLPDFIVVIKSVGYLATSSADSFIASSTVPVGSRPAVSFSIKNVGTNVSAAWRFSASIPTQSAYIFNSEPQQTLAPGDSIDYTLGFDQANRGANQTISITANYDKAVTESNSNNNSADAKITILGN